MSLPSVVHAQCPPNIDFESGNFSHWECKTGVVSSDLNVNQVTWSNSTLPEFDRHELIGPNDASVDRYGGFPKHCPNSSRYSVKLGNDNTGKEAEGLFYTFTIPANNNRFALVYYYAIVLQDPGHSSIEQPRFRARVVDVATETEVNCVSFDFTAAASLPGFHVNGGVVYRDWTPITVDLSAFAGKTLRLEFITSDCTLGGHFGYAYFDVNSICTQSMEGTVFCDRDTTITLKGPFGFDSYKWYTDTTFSQLKATTQNTTVTLSNVGSTFPLILQPFPGFGCPDTLYALIKMAPKPVSQAGPDQVTCEKSSVSLGAPPGGYMYQWSPAQYVSEPQISNPVTLPGLTGPTWFSVTTTDSATGCAAVDSALITPFIVDTTVNINGRLVYCPNDVINLNLTLNATGAAVQWLQGNSRIAGATQPVFHPTAFGNYRASITQNGCTDTTNVFTVRVTDFPVASFVPDKEVQCTQYPVHFTNRSTFSGTTTPVYNWSFGDGNGSSSPNTENLFTIPGTYKVKLLASIFDCKDSVEKTITIMKTCSPLVPTAFTPNNDGLNDRIKPVTPGIKKLVRFAIANRYGNFVFSTSKEGEAWDGTINGVQAKPGVYVWILEYLDHDGKPMLEKGTTVLIR
jgi:gliding motility-associated-like protein